MPTDAAPAPTPPATSPATPLGSVGEVFLAFLRLGLTSFGGPIAHLGYFREDLVVRRRWLDEAHYADMVALCQFLPGPASSQVGFALGVLRGGGLAGGIAAWIAFSLPSALVLGLAALFAGQWTEGPAAGLIHGLKLVAVAVVAQAVWGMARSLAADRPRAGIALAAVLLVTFVGGALGQLAAIVMGALAGRLLCPGASPIVVGPSAPLVPRTAALLALGLFVLLLMLPLALPSPAAALFGSFYRSGAFVFGGGHVVLPLLQEAVVAPGWVSRESFLAGYGLAQAVPGPLFTFAAWLGMEAMGPGGALLGLVALSLPGLLLVYGTLPFWDWLRCAGGAQAAMRGANAAVVGVLGAALHDPVWTSAVLTPGDFAVALAGFLALVVWQAPPILVVLVLGGFGVALA
ncbi:chromate efflux transporter [Zavarzinia sp. CC-PAN008]|uniref:chromate efflux transporter n=1 Tax=Zavarzinia sp. CC-PAN008 TaxID=3243332 RepID=UPI003F74784C